MSDRIVAYLDLLGFCSFVQQDKEGAIRLVADYTDIFSNRITDDNMYPPESYSEELRGLAKQRSIDSFEYFLPFSDSIVITSTEDPQVFLKQLGSFVLETFLFRAYAYKEKTDPTKIAVKELALGENGHVEEQEIEEYWFPPLFRSGIAFGSADILTPISMIAKEPQNTHVVAGAAMIEAVELAEKGGVRAPDILLSPSIIEKIKDEQFKRIYIEQYGKYIRLLWPALKYIEGNQPASELTNFWEMFRPAVLLWKHYSHLGCSDIYFNFLKLIVKSTMSFFSDKLHPTEVQDFIDSNINNLGIRSKKEAIWQVQSISGGV